MLRLRVLLTSCGYVALVLLPAALATAVDPFPAQRPFLLEASVGLGLLAFALIALQFALVSRLRAVSLPFGTDALVQWHQYVGLLSLAFAVGHALLLNAAGLTWRAWNPFFESAVTRSGLTVTVALVVLAMSTVWRSRLGLSYETWRNVHLAMVVLAIAAMTTHVVAAGGYTRAPVLQWTLAGYALAAGALVVYVRIGRPLGLRGRPWEVVANIDEGGSIRTLQLAPVGHDGLRFSPGQFAWLITGATPWSSQQHPLSISSSAVRLPRAGIQFSIKALGDWSSRVVPALAVGTRVWVDGPFGAFTIDRVPQAPGFVLICGGVGIAPLRSMLLTLRDRRDQRPAVLIFAAHDESRLAYVDELRQLSAVMNLHVTYVLEKPRGQVPAESGRLSVELLDRLLTPSARSYAFFVCGPPAMTTGVEHLLLQLGVPRRSIDTERFNVV